MDDLPLQRFGKTRRWLIFVVPLLTGLVLIALFSRTTAESRRAARIREMEELGGQVSKDRSGAVVSVNLSGRTVSDEWLLGLRDFSQLTDLNLSNTSVSDAGIRNISGITTLTALELAKTKISNAAATDLS